MRRSPHSIAQSFPKTISHPSVSMNLGNGFFVDVGNNSINEAGIDDFSIEEILCGSPCPADLDGSAAVDGADIGALLAAWGSCG